MDSASVSEVGGPRLTKRGLYFFVLWLPTLVPLIGLGVAVHLPFALVHALKARGRPTEQLLAKSWLVPPKVAVWAACETACLLAWSELFGRVGPNRSVWTFITAHDTSASFGFYVGLSFGLAIAYLGLGWLALFSFAARWPLDRSSGGASLS
jgi:hypothetical protein